VEGSLKKGRRLHISRPFGNRFLESGHGRKDEDIEDETIVVVVICPLQPTSHTP